MDSVETNRCRCMAQRGRDIGWCPHCLNSYKNGVVKIKNDFVQVWQRDRVN